MSCHCINETKNEICCSKPRGCEIRHTVQIKGEEKRRRRERE